MDETSTSKGETSTPPRATITGVGIISPLGIGWEETCQVLASRACQTGELTLFDPPERTPDAVGEAPEFDVEDYVLSQKAYLDRNSELMFAAMALALKDANITVDELPKERTGLVFATNWGGAGTLGTFFSDYLDRGPRRVKPFIFPHTYHNTSISLAAMEYGITGPHLCLTGSYTSGIQSLYAGINMIAQQEADIVIAGAIDALAPARLQACADPQTAMGEAAILFVLRPPETRHARAIISPGTSEAAFPIESGVIETADPSADAPETLTGNLESAGGCLGIVSALYQASSTVEPPTANDFVITSRNRGGEACSIGISPLEEEATCS